MAPIPNLTVWETCSVLGNSRDKKQTTFPDLCCILFPFKNGSESPQIDFTPDGKEQSMSQLQQVSLGLILVVIERHMGQLLFTLL